MVTTPGGGGMAGIVRSKPKQSHKCGLNTHRLIIYKNIKNV